MKFSQLVNLLLAVAVLSLIPSNARAITVWDETADGDLSSSGATPTDINVTAGTNSVIATMPGSDLDFLTIHVPADHEFTGLVLNSYASTDNTSFIGMQIGETIAVTMNPATLAGYAHFGGSPGPNNIGQDILDDIGTGAGAAGFTPPLPTGAYSFWIQQANTVGVSYQFDFIIEVIPEGLPGDFNGDEVVDAADYTVWRDNLGATDESALNGNGDGLNGVDAGDYTLWSDNFGMTLGSGSGFAAVPEPSSVVLLVLAAAAVMLAKRKR